jgi:hypothetical protein
VIVVRLSAGNGRMRGMNPPSRNLDPAQPAQITHQRPSYWLAIASAKTFAQQTNVWHEATSPAQALRPYEHRSKENGWGVYQLPSR